MIKEYGIYTSEINNTISIIVATSSTLILGFDLNVSDFTKLENKLINEILKEHFQTMIKYHKLFIIKLKETPDIFKNYGYLGEIEQDPKFRKNIKDFVRTLIQVNGHVDNIKNY